MTAGACPACGYGSLTSVSGISRCPECAHEIPSGAFTLTVRQVGEEISRLPLARAVTVLAWGGLILFVGAVGGPVAAGLTSAAVAAWFLWIRFVRDRPTDPDSHVRTVLLIAPGHLEEWIGGRRRRRWDRSRIAGWAVVPVRWLRPAYPPGGEPANALELRVRFRGRLALGKAWVLITDESEDEVRRRLGEFHGLAE